ncbi:MAG: hypothetical protein II393_02065 [Cytophagales bacterium]|nr:hypothetical protein [Cytophagales bacterium]
MNKIVRCLFGVVLMFIVTHYHISCTCGDCCGRGKKVIKTTVELQDKINEFLSKIYPKAQDSNFINTSGAVDDQIINDYFTMYQDMTKDIFLGDAALELMTYRELLRRCGIVAALKNIFSDPNKITWYPSINPLHGDLIYRKFYIKPSDTNSGEYEVTMVTKNGGCVKKNKNPKKKEVANGVSHLENTEITDHKIDTKMFGGFYVNDKPFEGLRCDGSCKDANNCVSCLLYNLLRSLNLCERRMTSKSIRDFDEEKDLFSFLFNMQGFGSYSSLELKKMVLSAIKKQSPRKFNSQLKIKEIKSHELTERTRQCIMIEWALTVELLKLLSPIIYGNSCNGTTILYRTIKTEQLEKEYKNKRDLFESTCIFGPAFTPDTYSGGVDLWILSYVKFPQVPIYRCIFNYIISPGKYSMFRSDKSRDHEQEIGCITLGLDFEELFNDVKDMEIFDDAKADFITSNHLKEGVVCEENINVKDKNRKVGKKRFWCRKNFLIEQFMQQLKQNFRKLKNNDIKEVILPEAFYYVCSNTSKIDIVEDGLTNRFWLTNNRHIIKI